MKIYFKEPENNTELCIEMAPIDFQRLLVIAQTMFEQLLIHLDHKEANHDR